MSTQNIALVGIITILVVSIVCATVVAVFQPGPAANLIGIIGGLSATALLQLFSIVKLKENTDVTVRGHEQVRADIRDKVGMLTDSISAVQDKVDAMPAAKGAKK